MSGTPPLAVGAKRLAALLGVSERTIRTWDSYGRLPRPIKLGGCVRWIVSDIEAWLRIDCPDRQTWEALRANGKAKT